MKKTKRADKLVIKAAAAAFVLFGLEAIGFTIALIIKSDDMSQYEEIKQKVEGFGKGCPLSGTDGDSNPIIIGEGRNGESGHFYEVQTAQSNGWLRTNTYYENGDTEETFDR